MSQDLGTTHGKGMIPAEYEEHAIIDGVHAKKVFPIELPPTGQTNGSYTLTRNASGYITTIEKVISGTTYTKTLTRDGDNYITDISVWS